MGNITTTRNEGSIWSDHGGDPPTPASRDSDGRQASNKKEVVLIPVDGSSASERMFDWYVRNMHLPGNVVYVLHSTKVDHPDGTHYPDYAIPPEDWNEKVEHSKRSSQLLLNKYEKKLQEYQIDGDTKCEFGRPGPSVIRSAKLYNATKIIMGNDQNTWHGIDISWLGDSFVNGKLKFLACGSSTVRYVVSHSSVPVTIIPNSESTSRTGKLT